MNENDGIDSDSDERLRRELRQLRADSLPERDLWPQIAARIATPANGQPTASRKPRGRWAPWALAASLLLAIGLVWQLQPLQPRTGLRQDALIPTEAQAMTREYRGALQEIAASAPTDVDASPALRDLDRSAAQIRDAIARDPDARFLLERLHHTYSLRLALTQRAALG